MGRRGKVFIPYPHERKRLHVQLTYITLGDYYGGYPHDYCWFKDEEGKEYSYQVPFSENYSKKTKIEKALEAAEGIWFDLTAVVIDEHGDGKWFTLFNPRLIKKYEKD